MLAYQKLPDLDALAYPMIASPKLDGIRCLIVDGVALSRSLKPIRNKYVQKCIGNHMLNGMDGELIVGPANDPDGYLRTNSGVMSFEGEPDFKFIAFDNYLSTGRYSLRLADVWGSVEFSDGFLVAHEFKMVNSKEELLEYEADVLDRGYEGLILREPKAQYKYGRSTLKEAALLKVKRFTDSEAIIVEALEAMYNDNEAQTNELGRTQRSQSQEGRTRGKGMVGKLVCRMPDSVQSFEIGTFKGLTNEDKTKMWEERHTLPGKLVKFKHFEHGAKDLPRHGVYLGLRDMDDV